MLSGETLLEEAGTGAVLRGCISLWPLQVVSCLPCLAVPMRTGPPHRVSTLQRRHKGLMIGDFVSLMCCSQ